ncbi:hypothetical protein N9V76_02750 [Candidatus Poseidoniales archaeon]|nr:hypothetical protein [Candidatus Poseidoniales archaeon]
MFTTIQFETLSTKLKERMRSPTPDARSEWSDIYRELPASITENGFQFIHIESNDPIFYSKDSFPRDVDFIPINLTARKFVKNNKPVVLVHVAFKFVKHLFESVEDAQRVLMKWSEYVHLNLKQLHPTAGKVEFQISDENSENSIDPIKFYNNKIKKGKANLPPIFAPTVLIDASGYTQIENCDDTSTVPDFTIKFVKHNEKHEPKFYSDVSNSIRNGLLIIHSSEADVLNQILRIAEVMSIRYMISDEDNANLVNSFLHHGFRSSEIIHQSRTAGVLSENNENETTTTSKNLILCSLTEGWKKPSQRNRFYSAIEKFDEIVHGCLHIKGDELRNSFDSWRKRYRDFCWELIDPDQKGIEKIYPNRRSIRINPEMNGLIKKQIEHCDDELFLRHLGKDILKLEDTIDSLNIESNSITLKELLKLMIEIIGGVLEGVWKRNMPPQRIDEMVAIASKYDLEKPPGVYTGLSNLHHPNTDKDLEDLEDNGVDFSLVQRLSVFNCINRFMEKFRNVITTFQGRIDAISFGTQEFFSIEIATSMGDEK